MKLKDLINKKIEKKITNTYLIAEIGVNHEGSLEKAKELVYLAKSGGADAVKFQTYKAETIASKNSPAYWDTNKEKSKNQYDLFKRHEGFWINEMTELKNYCDQIKIEFLSTPFDIESANFLNDLMDVYKISSSDITNKPFIEFICGFGKPIILSTGASTIEEIDEALSWINNFGNKTAILHCVLNYPTSYDNANLSMIKVLQKKYPDNLIGYSDHTLPGDMSVCFNAKMLGCSIIEKHFTDDKELPGNDHYHAMDFKDIKNFREKELFMEKIFGKPGENYLSNQSLAIINARRSLVAKRKINKNAIITKDDLTWKRPATGISPKFIDEVIGKKVKNSIDADQILQWDFLN